MIIIELRMTSCSDGFCFKSLEAYWIACMNMCMMDTS